MGMIRNMRAMGCLRVLCRTNIEAASAPIDPPISDQPINMLSEMRRFPRSAAILSIIMKINARQLAMISQRKNPNTLCLTLSKHQSRLGEYS